MSKKSLFLPVVALGAAGIAYSYFTKSHHEEQDEKKELSGLRSRLRLRKSSSKISRSLLRALSNIDNNRLIFIEIKTKSNQEREEILKHLGSLKTDAPTDEMWVVDFYKQKFSRDDINALTNKKTIMYLATLDEIEKIRISTSSTVTKIIGNSLSKLSTRYPSMEKYFFEPMLDIYAPLKETEDLNNFGVIKEGHLYRGGTPVGESHYDRLADLHVKTVINLKIEDSAVEYVEEQNNLLKRDIHLHYIPMPNVAPPTLLQALEFLTISYNSEMIPVFFHCHRGSDRTGIMAAIFRITQGYNSAWALAEAEKYNIASNFHNYKVEFVYEFERKWLKLKHDNQIPDSLNNFDFTKLLPLMLPNKEEIVAEEETTITNEEVVSEDKIEE